MKKHQLAFLPIYLFLLVGLFSCVENDIPQPVDDEPFIEQYIADNNLNAVKSDIWQVYFEELQSGTGDTVNLNSIVDVNYELSLLDENNTLLISDTNHVFIPSGIIVIEGLARGVLTMREGGKSLFLIPSRFGFGGNSFELSNGTFVPANAVLQSTITLNEVRTRSEQKLWEKSNIEDYLVQQQLDSNAFEYDEGLFKALISEGDTATGSPVVGNRILVDYEGSFLDGEVFDAGEAVQFNLTPGGLIEGFYEGVLSMNKGEEAIFIMTSDLGYGESGTNSIRPFRTLIFRIELIDFL